jgi:two-component system, OmpR family, sensor histidine kinase CiaH
MTGGAQSGDAHLLRRVRWQLVAWSGGIVLVVLVALGVVLSIAVARSLEATATAQLQQRADSLVRNIARDPGRPGPGRPPVGIAFGGPSSGTFAFVSDPSGEFFGPTGLEFPSGLPDASGIVAARQTGKTDIRTIDVDGTPVRILSEPIERGGVVYVLQVGQDITAERNTVGTLITVLAIGGLVAILAALAAGAVIARRALVPIRDALRRQREFAADASHELRTPLTVIRSSIDHLLRHRSEPVEQVGTALEDIDDEVGHMTSIVEDLLLLARSDSGAVELERVPIDLGDIAADATGALAALAAASKITIALDPSPVQVIGDAPRLRQLVTILVDNAIRHGPLGGRVIVTARAEGREAVLTVDDDGPGIPAGDRAHVFDRFWRAADARPGGTGLGLAIGAWIVDQHGGTIAVTERDGGGSRFVVRLPAAPSA